MSRILGVQWGGGPISVRSLLRQAGAKSPKTTVQATHAPPERHTVTRGHTAGHHPTTVHERAMGGDHSKVKAAEGGGDRSAAATKAWESRRGGKG